VEGEQVQFISRLYERHAPAVHRYALRRSDPDTAEEVTAQVFLVAWRRRQELSDEPLPWLYGVARRALADQRRGAARRVRLRDRLEGETAVVGSGGQAAELQAPELGLPDRDLSDALNRLSDADREALLLRYWEELEPVQIARVMGCSRAAAAVRLHRARGRLRRALEERAAPRAEQGPPRGGEDVQAHSCVERAESA
jgi:RNA polymerase sigma factor (sigma-70 family)